MSYETFRNEVLLNMAADEMPVEQIVPAIHAVDKAATKYDVVRKETGLTVINGVPEVLKHYIGTRATENLSPDTLKNYFYTLRDFFMTVNRPVSKVTANDIRCYLYDYKKKNNVSDRTLEQKRLTIKNFYAWCLREDVYDDLKKNPCETVSTIKYYAKPREPFTMSELETIRVCCEDVRERAIVDILVSAGLRVTELCDLKKDDIDLIERTVKVRHGKGNKFRMTYISAETVVSLRRYFNTRTDSCPYVFVNKRGSEKHQIHKKVIEQIFANICVRAGIEDPDRRHPHNLRHTFATVMLQNGAPIQHVQKMLGHAKLETTLVYAKDNLQDIKRTHERCAV